MDTKTIKTEKFITGKYKQIIESMRRENSNLPEQWLADSDDFIKRISSKLPKECLGIFLDSNEVLKSMVPTDNPLEGFTIEESNNKNNLKPGWYNLLILAKESDYSEIEKLCKQAGKQTVALGYLAICIITVIRLQPFLKANPVTMDAVYVFYAKELEKDPKSKPYIEKALEELSEYSRNKYKNLTGNEPDTGGDPDDYNKKIYSYVYDVVKSSLSNDLFENIVSALKGDRKLKNIPLYVARRFIDQYRKWGKRKSPNWGNVNNLDENIQSIESISNIAKIHEVVKRVDLEMWIDSIKDPINKKIATLRYKTRLTVREVGERLDIPKSTVQDRLKKLKPPS
ncbi:hypothetical protein MYX76_00920 [Desulfobacterota bacterium AH_259_B03_O07]|nr:hypothetical protein [Desulfobacterota bacterium AH_259_B03_O07]